MLIETLGPTAIPTIICLILGLLFFIIEMFTPGVGVPFVLGILCLVAALVMQFAQGNQIVALYITAIALVVTILAVILMMRSLQRGRLSRSFLVLNDSIDSGSTDLTSDTALALGGSVGVAITTLRPAGIVEIDGKRLDVTAAGTFVQKGCRVRVTSVEGLRILVEEENKNAPPTSGGSDR